MKANATKSTSYWPCMMLLLSVCDWVRILNRLVEGKMAIATNSEMYVLKSQENFEEEGQNRIQ